MIEKIVDFEGTTMYYKKGTKILHREDGPAVVFAGGNQYWYKDGELHREDGPAAEYEDGDRAWYIDGKLHREGAPAVVYTNGDKVWYRNGELHREDGPAVELADGIKEWYINGEQVSEEEFNAINGDVSTELKIISNVYIIEYNGEEIICRSKEELNKMIDHLM